MIAAHLDTFFEHATKIFSQAAMGSGYTEHDFKLADSTARISFAGDNLRQKVLPAISHLSTSATNSVHMLEILAWDTASTGMMLPPPPWESIIYSERAQLRSYADERYVLVYDRLTTVFEGVDKENKRAVYWTRDANWIPYYVTAAPMRHLLQGWLIQQGIFISHSAAVGSANRGILIAGKGGVGKSTTALLCMENGFSYLGDDFVLLSAEPEPTVYSLYSSAKLNRDSLEWLPDMKLMVTNEGSIGPEKALLFLHPNYTERLGYQMSVSAVVIPHASEDESSTVVPITGIEAFKQLAPDTVFRGQGDAHLVLHAYQKICSQIPCFRLNLGADRASVPDILRSLL